MEEYPLSGKFHNHWLPTGIKAAARHQNICHANAFAIHPELDLPAGRIKLDTYLVPLIEQMAESNENEIPQNVFPSVILNTLPF